MDPSLSHQTDSGLSHKNIVSGLLLCNIYESNYDGEKELEVTAWIAKVRDLIKFFFPDYHFIICKYPLEFADYNFQDTVLQWCCVIKDHRFRVFVFREGVIKDYKETGDIIEFYCGGPGKMERVQKNLNTDSQPFWQKQVVYELKFEGKIFDKDAWIEFIYKYLETQLPGLSTNPQQYLLAGRHPEWGEALGPVYVHQRQMRLQMEVEMLQGQGQDNGEKTL